MTIAPVNQADMALLADGLQALKRVAQEAGLGLKGATLNLDAGFDSKANRKSKRLNLSSQANTRSMVKRTA